MKKYWMPALLGLFVAIIGTTGCGGLTQKRAGMALVVQYGVASPEVREKEGLLAVSNAGRELFGAAGLTNRNPGNLSYYAESLPNTVRITWREGTETGKYWTTGRIAGDYTIRVRDRVPPEVFRYVNAAKGRAVRLIFRIKDDGVLFAWDVEESTNPGLFYSLHGGDVPCDVRPANAGTNCSDRRLQDMPWFGK